MGNRESQHYKHAYNYSQEIHSLLTTHNIAIEPLFSKDSPQQYPFSCIGVLTGHVNDHCRSGLAFIVHSNYIMTSASNCYSQQLAKTYSNIVFTINSKNYNISSIFVPKEYFSPHNNGVSYNYALLRIQGETKFEEEAGVIVVNFFKDKRNANKSNLFYISNSSDAKGKISSISSCPFLENTAVDTQNFAEGGPILCYEKGQYKAIGIALCLKSKKPEMWPMRFDQAILKSLKSYTTARYGTMQLQLFTSETSKVIEFLKKAKRVDKLKVLSVHCRILKNVSLLLQSVPFSDHLQIYLTVDLSFYPQTDLHILSQNRFRNIRALYLNKSRINEIGCQLVLDAGLKHLRILCLIQNPIRQAGCYVLKKGQWPFLSQLNLSQGQISAKCFEYLREGNWPNLKRLSLQTNTIKYSPQDRLDFSPITRWANLRNLSLKDNKVGNTGCKMIKLSGLVLEKIGLECNLITKVGVKWLCKADFSRLKHLQLAQNIIQQQGCQLISRANAPLLDGLFLDGSMYDRNINFRGLLTLAKSQWKNITIISIHYNFDQLDVEKTLNFANSQFLPQVLQF